MDNALANGLQGVATVVALLFGSAFSLLIIAVIGPAIYVMNRKTEELAEMAVQLLNAEMSEDVTVKENAAKEITAIAWREANGFVTTSQQNAVRLLATMGPVLAGPLLNLLNLGLA